MNEIRAIIDVISVFVLPVLIVGFVLYGIIRKVPVFEEFVEGAKGGFQVAIRIIPFLIGILL